MIFERLRFANANRGLQRDLDPRHFASTLPALARWRRASRRAFTLIEAMATILIIGVLTGIVAPIAVQWIHRAEYVRIAHDLDATRRAIGLFHLNMRDAYPDKLQDLVDPIEDGDVQFNQIPYSSSHVARWKGPYLSATLYPVPLAGFGDVYIFESRLGVRFTAFFAWFNASENTEFTEAFAEGAVDWLGIKTSEVSQTDFEELNDLIDGEAEPDGLGPGESSRIGRLRFVEEDESVSLSEVVSGFIYYLAIPYR